MIYFFPLLLVLALAGFARWRINHVSAQFKNYCLPLRMSGATAAESMLKDLGIGGITVVEHNGMITNSFDAGRKQIRLGSRVFKGDSAWAIGVACQQAAHVTISLQQRKMYLSRAKSVRATRFFSGFILILLLALFILRKITFPMSISILGLGWLLLAALDVSTRDVETKAARIALGWMKREGLVRSVEDEEAVKSSAVASSWSSLTSFFSAFPLFFYQLLPFMGGKPRK